MTDKAGILTSAAEKIWANNDRGLTLDEKTKAVVSIAHELGMSTKEFKDAVQTYQKYQGHLSRQIDAKNIPADPSKLENWDIQELMKESNRIHQQIQELQGLKATNKESIRHAVEEAKIIKHDLEAKEKYDLKGWDRIELDEQTIKDINTVIRDTFNSHGYDMRHVAVKKLAVTFKDEIYYFSAVSTNLLHVRIWDNYPSVQSFCADFDVKVGSDELKLVNTQKCSDDMIEFLMQAPDESGVRNFETAALMYLSMNEFMLHYKDVAFNIREIECKQPSKKIEHKKNSGPNVVRLVRQYKLKKNWKTKVERRKAEIQCKAWGVRGHFRHYKNGKVIFVEAYVKGKDRDQYQGKVYELLPRHE